MPITKQWSAYTGTDSLTNNIGVYELAYNKQCVYIGEGRIATRVGHHESKGWNITHVRVEETNSKRRAEQRESALLKQYYKKNGRTPKHNDYLD